MGVPKGNKFSGGNFKGCKPFRPPITVDVRDRESGVLVSAGSTLSTWVVVCASESESLIFRRPKSTGILDFLGAGKTGVSSSPLGDSYALGIAGTGGTSSPLEFPCSARGLGVGSRDEDRFWDSRF
jgi:hypothetical protein